MLFLKNSFNYLTIRNEYLQLANKQPKHTSKINSNVIFSLYQIQKYIIIIMKLDCLFTNSTLFSIFLILISCLLQVNCSHVDNKSPQNSNEHIFNETQPTDYDDDSFVLVDLSEFVARVKGGLKQAERIARKFNLKLVKQVFHGSNYFLFQQEIVNLKHKIQKQTNLNERRVRRSLNSDELHLIEKEPNVFIFS